jgi:hypothetical protein
MDEQRAETLDTRKATVTIALSKTQLEARCVAPVLAWRPYRGEIAAMGPAQGRVRVEKHLSWTLTRGTPRSLQKVWVSGVM